MRAIVDEFRWRGLIAQSTDEDALSKALAHGPVTFYCGFDPTAASLHVGHLVQVLTSAGSSRPDTGRWRLWAGPPATSATPGQLPSAP